MITNKDIRVEGSNLILNGEKHPLDPAVDALIKRANTVQGKLSALDTNLDAIEALEKTASGNPISITGAAAAYAKALSMSIDPIQDLHGYTNPWPAGGGKNLFNVNASPVEQSSVSLETSTSLGQIKVIATAITSGWQQVRIPISLNNGTHTLSITAETTSSPFAGSQRFLLYNATDQVGLSLDSENKITFTVENNSWEIVLRLNQTTNASVGDYAVWSGIQVEVGTSGTTFEPYSNICPISGLTSGEVQTTDGTDTNTATISLGQTVYGGSVNFKTGEVTVTHANIASYNGESINEPWLSSLDKYESGATPTTGAQVVYPLSTPITLTLTPAELELLKGENTISGNGVTINIGYIGR